MKRAVQLLSSFLLVLLLASTGWAQGRHVLPSAGSAAGSGVSVWGTADCTTITSPVAGQTWCFGTTDQRLMVYDGTEWPSITIKNDGLGVGTTNPDLGGSTPTVRAITISNSGASPSTSVLQLQGLITPASDFASIEAWQEANYVAGVRFFKGAGGADEGFIEFMAKKTGVARARIMRVHDRFVTIGSDDSLYNFDVVKFGTGATDGLVHFGELPADNAFIIDHSNRIAFGTTVNTAALYTMGGTYTAPTNDAYLLRLGGTLTPLGATNDAYQLVIFGQGTKPAAGAGGTVAALRILPATLAVAGDFATNVGLFIGSAPTNGTANWSILVNAGVSRFDGGLNASGNAGLTVTTTVRDAAGTGTCTLIFTSGLKTGGTC